MAAYAAQPTPINDKAFVTGAIDTFVFSVDTGTDTYATGGITLALPKGYDAIGGMATLNQAPGANVGILRVDISTTNVVKLYAYAEDDYAESNGETLKAWVVIYAKKSGY